MRFKKGYRYSVENVEKRKNPKRTVLSYEDVPLEEYKEENVEINKGAVKKVLIIVGVLLVLGLVVFAIANRESLTPEKVGHWFKYDVMGSHDTGYPVRIIGTTVSEGNFICDDGVSYVSDTTYESLSSVGNEVCYNRHSFSKPVLENGGDNVIIYNLGGNGYAVGNKKELSDVIKTKDDKYIFTADINSRGYYCVVTQADGYLSKLYVYNKDGEQVYAYSFADYYINSVALNESGTGCVACGVTGDNGSILGAAYVLDFKQAEPRATYNLDENAVYEIEYIKSDAVAIVASHSVFTINIGSSSLKQFDYGSMELTAYDINCDTDSMIVSLSRSGDGRLCSLQYINSDCEPVKTIDTKLSVESVDHYKNRIAVLASGKCRLYDTDGKSLGKADAGNGAKAVKLEDVDKAYILGINEIRKITEFK